MKSRSRACNPQCPVATHAPVQRAHPMEFEEGMTLPARVVGSGGTVGRRRVCFLQILSAPVPCYCVGKEWHELRA
jgi:hypothetical protein